MSQAKIRKMLPVRVRVFAGIIAISMMGLVVWLGFSVVDGAGSPVRDILFMAVPLYALFELASIAVRGNSFLFNKKPK